MRNLMPQTTLIISVYRDVPKLSCILEALEFQTEKRFEVIVSEDGESEEIAQLLHLKRDVPFSIRHLCQEDQGFRKNRALNKAILNSRTEHLIFIDGDCVPHQKFIEAHLSASSSMAVAAGRRVELGPRVSDVLVSDPSFIKTLSDTKCYLALLPRLVLDQVKNPESGVASRWIHRLTVRKEISIVGCNFSVKKEILEEVNGFNEDYEAPGIGEDSDLEWRLIKAGYGVRNIKFLAPLFHLWHARGYGLSEKNLEILNRTKIDDTFRARKGLESS